MARTNPGDSPRSSERRTERSRPKGSLVRGPVARVLMEGLGPGDAIHAVVLVGTLGLVGACATCRSWRQDFNRAGWRGFWKLLPAWVGSFVRPSDDRGDVKDE